MNRLPSSANYAMSYLLSLGSGCGDAGSREGGDGGEGEGGGVHVDAGRSILVWSTSWRGGAKFFVYNWLRRGGGAGVR
jgi:hypothetical protein